MTSTLKHIAVRLWISILSGGLLCLWLFPAVQSRLGLAWLPATAAAVLAVVFLGVGWLLNRVGMGMVDRLVLEAVRMERTADPHEAEARFHKAVDVYDSFLLSSPARKRRSADLAGRLARFYLARAEKNTASERFIVDYLEQYPRDKEAAESWLREVVTRGGAESGRHDLAVRIGEAQPDNRAIQYYLARFYISTRCTDFNALQTFRRVLIRGGRAAADIVGEVAGLFLEEGRADEWALKVYLNALRANPDNTALIRGVAAGVHFLPETDQNRRLKVQAADHLQRFAEADLEQMRAGFKPPPPEPVTPELILKENRWALLLETARGRMAGSLPKMVSATHAAEDLGRRLFLFIKRSPKARRALAVTAVVIVAVGVVLWMQSTIQHLVKTTPPPPKLETPVESPPPEPDLFTIQVAAYRNASHAERFVASLKKKHLDAFHVPVRSKNKRWYQVKISHFPTKEAARAYGESLKAKGIIEDFYIDNYRKPAAGDR